MWIVGEVHKYVGTTQKGELFTVKLVVDEWESNVEKHDDYSKNGLKYIVFYKQFLNVHAFCFSFLY